jgi:O-antigen/teichoic acid export membrane protein
MRSSYLILSNAASIWVARILLVVPQVILVPYLIRTIGETGYGTYALIWSLMTSIDQLQTSLQQGVVKYGAGFLAQGRMDEVNEVVSSSFVYSMILAVAACVGTLIAARFYDDPSGQVGPALVIVGGALLFMFPITPYIAVIQSRQRYYVDAIARTVSGYISLLAVMVWFHTVGPSVNVLIMIMAGTWLISRLAQIPTAYRLVPSLHNRLGLCNWRHFRLLFSFGGVIVLIGLCLMANSTGVRWMMGALVSTTFVGHLAIMLMPVALLSDLIMAVTVSVMPATSAYVAAENSQVLRELLVRGMRYTMVLTLAGLLAAAVLMRDVLGVWVGPEYMFLSPYALALFASASFMLSTSTSHHMLKGLGRLRTTVFISLMGLVLVPIGMILAVFHICHNPYVAVTSGLATGNIAYGCLQVVFGARAVHADLRSVVWRVYVQPLLVALLVSVPVFALTTFGAITGLAVRTCVSVLAVLLFFSGCYFLVATVAERQQVKEVRRLVLHALGSICRREPG